MGPQPFGCGRALVFCGVVANACASMGPQPFGCGRAQIGRIVVVRRRVLQWGRNLSVAEGAQPRHRFSDGRGASMGPQPFGCGRDGQHKKMAAPWSSFNGAATFRLRKAWTCSQRPYKTLGFNGAATFRLRKGLAFSRRRIAPLGFNGAATFRLRKGTLIVGSLTETLASMGPQPFGCGRRPRRARSPSSPRFNGAATFRLRKAPWVLTTSSL